MKRIKVLASVCMVSLLIAATAFAAKDDCWKPKRPACPDGVSSENGRRCGLPGAVIAVSDEGERTRDVFCALKSRDCNGSGDCNQRIVLDAFWLKVYCVEGNQRRFVGWCLSQEYSRTALNEDCSGRKCKAKVIVSEEPITRI